MTEAVVDAPAKVIRYLDRVRQLADANRDALGFLPATAYEEAAMRGCLWVVVGRDVNELRGYLFFGNRFPRLRVYQVYVTPEYRSFGTARRLIEKLKRYGEAHDYLTITARVASELPANEFWSNLGFQNHPPQPGWQEREDDQSLRIRSGCAVAPPGGRTSKALARRRNSGGDSDQAGSADALIRDGPQRTLRCSYEIATTGRRFVSCRWVSTVTYASS